MLSFLSLSAFSSSVHAAENIVTLPLLPHHVITRRRRALTEIIVDDSEEQQRRDEHYQARFLSFFGSSNNNDSTEQTAKQVSVIYQGYGVSYFLRTKLLKSL